MTTSAQTLHAFETEALALESALGKLTEADYARPTNCPPWSVKDLVVHIAQGLSWVGKLTATTKPVTLNEAADYYRRAVRKTSAYHQDIADRAQAEAASLPDGAAAARLLAERWREALWACASADGSEAVESASGVSSRTDMLTTRVIAHAAHGLDLALSLETTPWTTQAALDVMRPVFVSLFGGEPPVELGWDEPAFFACATGRRSLADGERTILGDRADAFPLLS
ncbi:maleylpyruvate isomerase mycothiol-dependent enzyme family protein [Flindersiella endophytica]